MSKAQIAVAALFIVLQSVTVAVLVNNDRAEEELSLLRERVVLLEDHVRSLRQLEVVSNQLCEIKLGMGRVCRAALTDLIQRLGLDDQPGSAARTVLEVFDGLGGTP